MIATSMPPITLGQRFESLQAFKSALRSWAIEKSFNPAILDSDSRRVRAGCRSKPNCPFRARCNFNEKQGVATVTTLHDVHACKDSAASTETSAVSRAETSKLKFLIEAVPQLIHVDANTSTRAIIDAVKAKYGKEIALRQAQKVKSTLCPKPSSPGGPQDAGERRQTRASTNNNDLQAPAQTPILEDYEPSPSEPSAMQLDREDFAGSAFLHDNPDERHHLPRHEAPLDAETRPPLVHIEPALRSTGPVPQQHMYRVNEEFQPQAPDSYSARDGRTPQEIRVEAAVLFQRASEKFQEATMLHAEATRLFASVANT